MAARKSWRRDIKAGKSPMPKVRLDKAEADAGEAVFRSLPVPDMIGHPTLGDVCGQWYIDIVRAFFGTYDVARHIRRLTEFFVLVPKKNGKSSYTAGLAVTQLIRNRRPEAEYYIIAPTKEIAKIIFRQAKGTIAASGKLTKLLWVRDNKLLIEHRRTKATLAVIAADTNVLTGQKPTGVFIDETHEFSRKSNAFEVMRQIRSALTARRDGFLFQITTQSDREPQGLFRSELQRARKVRDGVIDLPLLPVMYEWPEDWVAKDKWRQSKYWRCVNPNLGKSVDLDWLEREWEIEQDEGAEAVALFASQHFNIEIGTRVGDDYWVGGQFWDSSQAEFELTLDDLMARSDVAVVGIDGGGRDDLLGLSVIGREQDTRRWLHWARAWAHPVVLERNKRIRSDLIQFQNDGTLTVIKKNQPQQDINEIVGIICDLQARELLPSSEAVGLDPQGVTSLVDALLGAGVTKEQLCAVPQGGYLHGTIHGLERKLTDGSFVHEGSALMRWSVGNARTELSGNRTRITKQISKSAKIDTLMATLGAAYLMSRGPEAGVNYYANFGFNSV